MSKSKYQAGFGVIFRGKKSQTLMIPICSTTELYDTTVLYEITVTTRTVMCVCAKPAILFNVSIVESL